VFLSEKKYTTNQFSTRRHTAAIKKRQMRSQFLIAFCAILGIATGFQQQQFLSQTRSPFVQTPGQFTISNAKSVSPSFPARLNTATTTTTQLNAFPALSSSPLGALGVLAAIVIVHESGHYLAARAFNITVEEFSVGFGPKLAGFDAFGNEFNLRALPLGGFVRFPENYDGQAYIENEDSKVRAKLAVRRTKKESNEWKFQDKLLDYATLGYWTEKKLEQWRDENRVQMEAASKSSSGSFFQRIFGSKSTKPKTENGDQLDINEVYKDLDELDKFEVEYFDDPQLLQNRPWQERAVVLSGGVIFNLILALSIYFAAIGPLPVGSSAGLPRAVFADGVVVSQAPRADGPSNGLLKQGDVITGINGELVQVAGAQKTSVTAGQKQVTDVISKIRATPDGKSVSVNVLRDQSETTLNIKPQRSADGSDVQTIGVMLSPRLDRLERLKSDNPIVAFSMAWDYLSDIFQQTLFGTLSVLTSFLSSSGPPPGTKISGPIGLLSQGSSVVATKDWTTVLLFAAGLSVNLGVINALPLPALDGGQLVFVVAEAITGKKVDQKVQERVTSVAVLFLLWVSLNAAIGDVGSLFQ
jgi:membrane-associated protease RseP (regulator of RpoE activity)